MSVVVSISASSVLSIHPSDDEHQEITEEFLITNYGEKLPAKIAAKMMAKIPDNIILTLDNAKFLEKPLVILTGEITK